MTCNMLLKLSGQGAVYVRSKVKLDLDNHNESDHSDSEDLLYPAFDIKQEQENVVTIPYDDDCSVPNIQELMDSDDICEDVCQTITSDVAVSSTSESASVHDVPPDSLNYVDGEYTI